MVIFVSVWNDIIVYDCARVNNLKVRALLFEMENVILTDSGAWPPVGGKSIVVAGNYQFPSSSVVEQLTFSGQMLEYMARGRTKQWSRPDLCRIRKYLFHFRVLSAKLLYVNAVTNDPLSFCCL